MRNGILLLKQVTSSSCDWERYQAKMAYQTANVTVFERMCKTKWIIFTMYENPWQKYRYTHTHTPKSVTKTNHYRTIETFTNCHFKLQNSINDSTRIEVSERAGKREREKREGENDPTRNATQDFGSKAFVYSALCLELWLWSNATWLLR